MVISGGPSQSLRGLHWQWREHRRPSCFLSMESLLERFTITLNREALIFIIFCRISCGKPVTTRRVKPEGRLSAGNPPLYAKCSKARYGLACLPRERGEDARPGARALVE